MKLGFLEYSAMIGNKPILVTEHNTHIIRNKYECFVHGLVLNISASNDDGRRLRIN
jgi:hypothetical protein